ncbi:MAG TPA: glycosyltransferase family 4 protein [Terriglobia bacterium]|nr:glycosyltransferase family 4 protein [Terriglobia bacterium]
MRILLTNVVLTGRTGTEMVVRDLALELKRRGHDPQVYSPALGAIAEELRSQGVPVLSDLRRISPPPDVIHGHHHPPTLAALLRFPDAPAVVVCHDATAWEDDPLIFPRVLRYVAVDDRCKRRFDDNPRIPPERVRVIFNAVDLSRYKPRSPLPGRPRRAAIFSNYATERTHTPVVRRACRSLGLPLDILGAGASNPVASPEEVLPRYDLVFAKARCALEAMAVGAAVVLCDATGLGTMVSSAHVARLRRLNFGAGTLTRPLDAALIAAEIQKYDPQDARSVSEEIRATAGLSTAITEWVELYNDVRREPLGDDRRHARELAALADYLEKYGFEAGMAWQRTLLRKAFRWPFLGNRIEKSLKSGWLRRYLRNV